MSSYASFATFVDAPASSPRSSRLVLASVVACSALAFGLALAFTLERLSILRMPGPKTRFELVAVMIAEPPKVADPPPKPEEIAAGDIAEDLPSSPRPVIRDANISAVGEPGDDSDSDPSPQGSIGASTIPGGRSSQLPCPGGICSKGAIGIPGGGGSCVGPNCSTTKALAKAPPPKPLAFSSLGCIACADPSIDALRRTAAGIRKHAGTNVTRFCVDATGHVEPGSVATATSHGDAAIDRLCRDTVKGWRFSPTMVAGEARRACSQTSFRIRFE